MKSTEPCTVQSCKALSLSRASGRCSWCWWGRCSWARRNRSWKWACWDCQGRWLEQLLQILRACAEIRQLVSLGSLWVQVVPEAFVGITAHPAWMPPALRTFAQGILQELDLVNWVLRKVFPGESYWVLVQLVLGSLVGNRGDVSQLAQPFLSLAFLLSNACHLRFKLSMSDFGIFNECICLSHQLRHNSGQPEFPIFPTILRADWRPLTPEKHQLLLHVLEHVAATSIAQWTATNLRWTGVQQGWSAMDELPKNKKVQNGVGWKVSFPGALMWSTMLVP